MLNNKELDGGGRLLYKIGIGGADGEVAIVPPVLLTIRDSCAC